VTGKSVENLIIASVGLEFSSIYVLSIMLPFLWR